MSLRPVPHQVLEVELADVRPFARLLRGIGFKHNAVMSVSEAGFEVTLEEVRTLCAVAWIPVNLFKTFIFHPSPVPAIVEISLDTMLQCLNIFGNAGSGGAAAPSRQRSSRRWAGDGEQEEEEQDNGPRKGKEKRTQMRMTWEGIGSELMIHLQDEGKGPVTTCALKTLEPEELMNQEFDDDQRVLYIIMKSGWFRQALADLPPSCKKVTFTATPRDSDVPPPVMDATGSSNDRRTQRARKGNFSILAEGDLGKTELDYPNDREVMDRFECPERISFSYHAAHIMLLYRALQHSIKICIQIETEGFLCVQIMMPVGEDVPVGGHSGILEFKKVTENDSRGIASNVQMHALEEGM
ncbi:hypothetical protein TREMEDRAFT_70218 [Tremella mesenterica DSM 1558]|uniref:uncharacterized protein n=1 Tax=Tremella mesenterica (strain ATCC 24925 / CBS 8224 / DSM 1558 / NBRC 9311 / NRRL Y-6157 / RJB 2259-6 / UBC 559-6) TaxID=578456 RepID=UPI00032D4371|nr:uncharacterized protein TREMEDRAFT_70218 [Tremella mesenterica DSM 1558]EIW66309.1 hypothetical protein TREMEDRAFT_70218 [Tremella mesenterica DSM 1558]